MANWLKKSQPQKTKSGAGSEDESFEEGKTPCKKPKTDPD